MTQVSWSCLQDYVSQKLARTPRQIKISGKSPGKLTIECDEMWSFINSKKNEVYIWLAIDRNSRKNIGCHIRDRTRKSAPNYGLLYLNFISNAPSPIQIFGRRNITVIPPKRPESYW